MQATEFILSASWVLPIAPDNTALRDHGVAVSQGRIVGLAPIKALQQQYPTFEHTHFCLLYTSDAADEE